jgi:hypothetical protein
MFGSIIFPAAHRRIKRNRRETGCCDEVVNESGEGQV